MNDNISTHCDKSKRGILEKDYRNLAKAIPTFSGVGYTRDDIGIFYFLFKRDIIH